MAEDSHRQVDQQVPGQVEPRELGQPGQRAGPHMRQSVISQSEVSENVQSGEDVIR